MNPATSTGRDPLIPPLRVTLLHTLKPRSLCGLSGCSMNLPPPFVPYDSVLTGTGVSSGVAIGPAQVFIHRKKNFPCYRLDTLQQTNEELARFHAARAEVRCKLEVSREGLLPVLKSQAGIIDAHLMILDDPLVKAETTSFIREGRYNAEQAVLATTKKISSILAAVEDEYIRARVVDVEMVTQSILYALSGGEALERTALLENSILVMEDISPAEVFKLSRSHICGLATENGGRTSHSAIMSQALELPAVLGVKDLISKINNGDLIILDGRTGHIIVRPDQVTLDFYQVRQRMERSFTAEVVRSAYLPALTLDDCSIKIMSNMELVEELPAVMSYGGDGVGLYRTEFMYQRPQPPSEEELYSAYRQVVESVAPGSVTIRTMDLGYDKMPCFEAAEYHNLACSEALGLRGIRYSLKYRHIFKTQLRAILRASACGRVKIMLPMISCLEEIRETKIILGEVRCSLQKEGLDFSTEVPLGIMIEIPATIFLAPELAAESAFFSVGTNDLLQYSLAVDRANQDVAEMFQPLHPAVWRMLKTVVDVGLATSTPVSICGDMAADVVTAPLLIGLGVRVLSMPPAAIPKIKRLIRMASFEEMKGWTQEVLASSTAREASGRIMGSLSRRFPELYS